VSTINIAGLNKAEVLIALFHGSQKIRLGRVVSGLSMEKAESLLQGDCYFDYLDGFVMKVDLSSDEVETWLYDRDLCAGAFEAAISHLQAAKK
jgi:hypothetical protein